MGMVKAITRLTQMMGQFSFAKINMQILQHPLDREFATHLTQQVATTHPTHEHEISTTNYVFNGVDEKYEPTKTLLFDY
jgi:hypothetical protein